MSLAKAIAPLCAASWLVIAACSDSTTEPATESSSFELQIVDNSALPALLWNKLGGQVLMNSATLQPHGPGTMRDVRVIRENYPGGFALSRDSTIVEVQVSGARYIIRRPHPNPSLVRVDTGMLENGLLVLPTTLDYRAQMGVDLKRVELKYTVAQ
jgi:hypothetical protein